MWEKVSEEAKDFIRQALNKDKHDRPEAKSLLDHIWIKKQVKEPEIEESVQLEVGQHL